MTLVKNSVFLIIALVTLFSADLCAETVNDFSRLNPVEVTKVVDVHSVEDINKAIVFAAKNNLNISISGKRNSQGGHTANKGGVVLNMNNYNKIVSLSRDTKTITVQSGASWRQIQSYINGYGLAIKVAQSANIFSVGGSLGANIHGRDPRYGTIAETVKSFKIVLSDGRHIKVSRQENPELFFSAIGGYGLIGVITEVELSLIDNRWLKKTVLELPYTKYVAALESALSEKLALHYGRCSIVKNDGFFRDCVSVNYIQQDEVAEDVEIEPETNVGRDKYFFGLSRHYGWGKSLRWWLQSVLLDEPGEELAITRNNAMNPPISFIEYYSEEDTDFLQEYFVPKESFNPFLSEMREIFLNQEVNVISMTLRYVPKSETVYLNYGEQDSVAVVLYMNVGLNQAALNKAKRWTQSLVDLTLRFKGKYYLTYQRYPTKSQFQQAYPRWREFLKVKRKYDKSGLFANEFYKQYF